MTSPRLARQASLCVIENGRILRNHIDSATTLSCFRHLPASADMLVDITNNICRCKFEVFLNFSTFDILHIGIPNRLGGLWSLMESAPPLIPLSLYHIQSFSDLSLYIKSSRYDGKVTSSRSVREDLIGNNLLLEPIAIFMWHSLELLDLPVLLNWLLSSHICS